MSNAEAATLPQIEGVEDEEAMLTAFLMEGLNQYFDQYTIKRVVLIGALSNLLKIVFCHQGPSSVNKQCEEINDFCNTIKFYARNKKE